MIYWLIIQILLILKKFHSVSLKWGFTMIYIITGAQLSTFNCSVIRNTLCNASVHTSLTAPQMCTAKLIHNCSSERKQHCVFAVSADLLIRESGRHLPALPDPDLCWNSGKHLQTCGLRAYILCNSFIQWPYKAFGHLGLTNQELSGTWNYYFILYYTFDVF